MTPEQIKELNELVATKVMGWTPLSSVSAYWNNYPSTELKLREWVDQDPRFDVWSPMTNIQDAWEVVEKIKAEKDVVIRYSVGYGGWNVIKRVPTFDDYDSKYYPTPTEAICRYALSLAGEKC